MDVSRRPFSCGFTVLDLDLFHLVVTFVNSSDSLISHGIVKFKINTFQWGYFEKKIGDKTFVRVCGLSLGF